MNPTYTLKITTKSTLLTHLPLDKMVAILANYNFKCIFLNENDRIPIRISLKFVPLSPIYNKSTLVQVMARCRTGDKPLSEPMLTHFTDAYMPHQGDMSWGWSKWAVFCRRLAEIWSYTVCEYGPATITCMCMSIRLVSCQTLFHMITCVLNRRSNIIWINIQRLSRHLMCKLC